MSFKVIKSFAFKYYRLINHIPIVNNRKKGKVEISNSGSILVKCVIKSIGNNNKLVFGKGGVFNNCEFTILGDNNVISFANNCLAKNGSFYIEDSNNSIVTKDNTLYAGSIHIACTEGTNITIGNNCLFSSEVVIRSGDSHSIYNNFGDRINQAKDVCIEDHVWVGHRAIITKGTHILNDSVVGTGSVVTRNFSESNCVIAGNPAEVIRENVNWDKDRK